jgi:hypothetical protein
VRTSPNSKGCQSDLAWLAKLRAISTLEELEVFHKNHCNKTAPQWKRVAIRRRIATFVPRRLDWVLCLHEFDVRTAKEWQTAEWMATLERVQGA